MKDITLTGVNTANNTIIYPLKVQTFSTATADVQEGIGTGIEFLVENRGNILTNTGWIENYGFANIPSTTGRWGMRFKIRDNTTIKEMITITPDSRCGINKTNPQTTLDVDGTITSTSLFTGTANISNLVIPDAELTIAKISGLTTQLSGKQNTLTAGSNITINGNVISSTGADNNLTGGDNISVFNGVVELEQSIKINTLNSSTANVCILNIPNNALTILNTSGLQSALNAKQATLTAGTNISIINNAVNVSGLGITSVSGLQTALNGKQATLTAGNGITIDQNNLISSSGGLIAGSNISIVNSCVDLKPNISVTGTITSNGLTIQKSTGNSTLSIIDAATTRNPRIELIRGSSTFGGDIYTDWRMHNDGGDLKFYRQTSNNATNTGESMYLPYNGGLVVNSGTITSSGIITAQSGLIAKNAYLTNFGTSNDMILKNTTMADTSYLVAQGSDGTSNINCHSGKKIIIRVGDAEKGSIDTNGLTMSGTIAGGTLNGTTINATNINVADKIIITHSSPTLYLKDTDHRSGMVHMNANRMYFLSGANNSTVWKEVNGRWPLYLQTDTNAAYFGGHIDTPSTITAGGTITTPTLNATNIGGSTTYGSDWARGGKSIIKNYNADANWAQFSHYNFAYSNTQYALLQHSNGTTLVNCAAGTQLEFRRENAYRLKLDSDGSGTFAGWSRATSHRNYSDDRLKHNEIDISGLEIVRQLNPKKYDKTFEPIYDIAGNPMNDYHGEIEKEHFQEAGFVAQEVLKTDISWVVSEPSKCSEEGTFEPYTVDYNCIMTYGIQAIKELDIIVQRLEKRIGDLEAENDLLTSRVEELETATL